MSEGPPDETFLDMLLRHEKEREAHLKFLAEKSAELQAEDDLANGNDLGSMAREDPPEVDLESDIRETW